MSFVKRETVSTKALRACTLSESVSVVSNVDLFQDKIVELTDKRYVFVTIFIAIMNHYHMIDEYHWHKI